MFPLSSGGTRDFNRGQGIEGKRKGEGKKLFARSTDISGWGTGARVRTSGGCPGRSSRNSRGFNISLGEKLGIFWFKMHHKMQKFQSNLCIRLFLPFGHYTLGAECGHLRGQRF